MIKKTLIASLVLTSAILGGCSKVELSNPKIGSTNSLSALNGRMAPASAGDGQNDLLGYGYDITGDYANSSASTFSVIDVARLKAEQPTRVEWDLSSTQEGTLDAGEDAVSYLKKITGKISSSLTLPLFKSTLTASFSDSTAFSSRYI